MRKLTNEEFIAVTQTFVNRLSQNMSSAGCNDVFEDEFPKSVCEDFKFDFDVLDSWKNMITQKDSTLVRG